MEQTLKGIASSPGIVIGYVYLFLKPKYEINKNNIADTEKEKERLLSARDKTKAQLLEIKDIAEKKLGSDKAQIFEAHINILEDEDLFIEVSELIDSGKITAENALLVGIDVYKQMLLEIDDEYLAARADDLKDIAERWVMNLLDIEILNLSKLPKDSIIVGYDLTPSDTTSLELENTLGLVTEIGGRTSHTSIMARSLEIPAVVGVSNICSTVKTGDKIILDGLNGNIIVNPDETTLTAYDSLKTDYLVKAELLKQYRHKEAISKDGTKVKIYANIGSPADLNGALKNGAEGIGLYRTEFLFMENSNFPSEEEQFEAYKIVASAMEGHTVTIRTMDIGGDKSLSYLEMPKEENPALGWRALRICLDRPEILKTQFRACLRASAFGKIKVMLPMIVSFEELRKSKAIFEECKKELEAEDKDFNFNIELGMMVETPSVVFRAEEFGKEVDFFSIGTNDLTQYTLASDRGNEKIADLCDPYNPSVLKAIEFAIKGAHRAGIVISMCGELAGDLMATPLLFGMGLDIFSMSAITIAEVKKMIISLEKSECEMLAKRVLSLDTAEEVKAELKKFIEMNNA